MGLRVGGIGACYKVDVDTWLYKPGMPTWLPDLSVGELPVLRAGARELAMLHFAQDVVTSLVCHVIPFSTLDAGA
eukprot:5733249-Amphidinium_carterae.1